MNFSNVCPKFITKHHEAIHHAKSHTLVVHPVEIKTCPIGLTLNDYSAPQNYAVSVPFNVINADS